MKNATVQSAKGPKYKRPERVSVYGKVSAGWRTPFCFSPVFYPKAPVNARFSKKNKIIFHLIPISG
ncbi:hypothetical protein SAMN05660816_01938 [Niastella yeongjuensis]|nr:hypothetical protein SAMN05660816_01938 [Niastella yeongjuensis]